MRVRGGRRIRPAGSRVLMVVVLVAVVGLAGCAGSREEVAGSAGGSLNSPTPASTASLSASSPADLAAEVGRLVNLYLAVKTKEADLIESVLVNVNGQELFAHYSADSGPAVTHDTYSVAKSVISMLVGIAIGEGLIGSVDQSLAELLPADVPTMAPGVGAVTLRQLLTMTGGIIGEDNSSAYTADANWTAVTLGTPLVQPAGTGFLYSDYGADLISAILVQATGRSVPDFAREKLFNPLRISTDPQGLNHGGGGLKITAPDMITLGRLYLQQGQWNGQQLVPAEWVQESTSLKFPTDDWVGGYGYFWWLPRQDDHPAFAALGYAGQLIEVIPDLKLVVAVSCSNPPTDGPDEFDAGGFVEMVDQQIVPVLVRG